jgi:hypothetical protein
MKLDFEPSKGDHVAVIGYRGEFEIKEIFVGADGHYHYRLTSAFSGLELDDVIYPWLVYSDEERIRKVIPQILPEFAPWPVDLEKAPNAASLKYEISSGEMHDGSPKVIISFFARPDAHSSLARAKDRIVFYDKLRDRLLTLLDLEPWIEFNTKEERSLLSAAS